jgi:hypothetical protein
MLLRRRADALEQVHAIETDPSPKSFRDQLRLVVATLSQAVAVDRHGHEGGGTSDADQRLEGRRGRLGEDRRQARRARVLERR